MPINTHTKHLLQHQTTPLCIVLGACSITGLSIARCLGKMAVPVIGIDKAEYSPRGFSRFVRAAEQFRSEDELLTLLSDIAKAGRFKNTLFCDGDEYVLFFDKHKTALSRFYNCPLTLNLPLAEMIDKKIMLQVAARIGMDVPRTIDSTEMPLSEWKRNVTYPCFVKPYTTQWDFRAKGEVVNSPAGLEDALRKPRFTDGCLIQEIIPGPETNIWFYGGYVGMNVKAGFTGYKIRQIPKDFGGATVAFSKKNNEVIAWGDALLRQIDYRGFFDIEFKQNEKGRYQFIEINLRLAGWNQLAVASGINLPYIAYADINDIKTVDSFEQKDGVQWTSMVDDFITCFKYYSKENKLMLWDWLKTALTSKVDAFFDITDINPFLFKIEQCFSRKRKRNGSREN